MYYEMNGEIRNVRDIEVRGKGGGGKYCMIQAQGGERGIRPVFTESHETLDPQTLAHHTIPLDRVSLHDGWVPR